MLAVPLVLSALVVLSAGSFSPEPDLLPDVLLEPPRDPKDPCDGSEGWVGDGADGRGPPPCEGRDAAGAAEPEGPHLRAPGGLGREEDGEDEGDELSP